MVSYALIAPALMFFTSVKAFPLLRRLLELGVLLHHVVINISSNGVAVDVQKFGYLGNGKILLVQSSNISYILNF